MLTDLSCKILLFLHNMLLESGRVALFLPQNTYWMPKIYIIFRNSNSNYSIRNQFSIDMILLLLIAVPVNREYSLLF